MTYEFGHQSHDILVLQQALVANGFSIGPEGPDGGFGPNTLQGVKDAQTAFKIYPADGVVRADLISYLGMTPSAPKPSIFGQIGDLASIIKQVKGLQMDTATVDVKSAWLSSKNWAQGVAIATAVAAFFHIGIPVDLGPTLIAFVTAAVGVYTIVKNTWFTSTISAASAKKL